jgi:dihydroorotate dehydrogenase
MYQHLLKPLMFRQEPEQAHHLTMRLAALGLNIPLLNTLLAKTWTPSQLPVHQMGLTFKNPVGLAAGFDKDGQYLSILPQLGFGYIEVGTVTPKPQGGNPQPRLFRLPKDQALINRMGFNNEGLAALRNRLEKLSEKDYILGGNIGKNKDTANEDAHQDYLTCFHGLADYVDYFVVNVSSPNTPGLRALQEKEPLTKLLSTLQDANHQIRTSKPILLKIAPDINDYQLEDIVHIIEDLSMTGIVATNTTLSREHLLSDSSLLNTIGQGGLSGGPLKKRSDEIVQKLRAALSKDKVIIGVGGITQPEHAYDKMVSGADLVQVYSGLVYYGPTLIKDIVHYLSTHPTSSPVKS